MLRTEFRTEDGARKCAMRKLQNYSWLVVYNDDNATWSVVYQWQAGSWARLAR